MEIAGDDADGFGTGIFGGTASSLRAALQIAHGHLLRAGNRRIRRDNRSPSQAGGMTAKMKLPAAMNTSNFLPGIRISGPPFDARLAQW